MNRRRRRSLRDELSALLEGDRVFLHSDPGAGAGGSGDGDPGGAGDGGEGEGGRSQADDDGAQGGDGDDDGTQTISLDEARKLRKENQQLRRERNQTAAELKKRQDAELSDQERLQRERDEERAKREKAEEKARSMRVQVSAVKVGVRAEAAVAAEALVDWSAIDDPDDDRQLERALKGLRDKHGYLFGALPPPASADGGARDRDRKDDRGDVRPGIGTLTRAYAKKD